MAAIYTTEGNELTAGLQGCDVCDEAIKAAERFADDLGADVVLNDDDGEWIVHPAIDGKREPADMVNDDAASDEAPTGEVIRYGTFGPIVWDLATGATRCATQRDMDALPLGDDLTAAEEQAIEE